MLFRSSRTDDLEIRVEIPESIRQDPAKIAQFESRLSYEISGTLGIRVRLELLPPKSLPRSEGKSQRVIDKRKPNP